MSYLASNKPWRHIDAVCSSTPTKRATSRVDWIWRCPSRNRSVPRAASRAVHPPRPCRSCAVSSHADPKASVEAAGGKWAKKDERAWRKAQSQVEDWLMSADSLSIPALERWCIEQGAIHHLDHETWWSMGELVDEVPFPVPRRRPNPAHLSLSFTANGRVHFVRFLEHGLKGKTAPLEVVRDQIVELVLQSRRQKLREPCVTPCTSKPGRTVRCAVKICEFCDLCAFAHCGLPLPSAHGLAFHSPMLCTLDFGRIHPLAEGLTAYHAQADSRRQPVPSPHINASTASWRSSVMKSSWPATSATV